MKKITAVFFALFPLAFAVSLSAHADSAPCPNFAGKWKTHCHIDSPNIPDSDGTVEYEQNGCEYVRQSNEVSENEADAGQVNTLAGSRLGGTGWGRVVYSRWEDAKQTYVTYMAQIMSEGTELDSRTHLSNPYDLNRKVVKIVDGKLISESYDSNLDDGKTPFAVCTGVRQ